MMNNVILDLIRDYPNQEDHFEDELIKAVKNTFVDENLDFALKNLALILPSENYLGEQMVVIDVDKIHECRKLVKKKFSDQLKPLLLGC